MISKCIKKFHIANGATLRSPWITQNLIESGETCSVQRVVTLMRQNRLRAEIGYKRRYMKGGKISNVADNILDRGFNPDKPNIRWVSDITYVRTYEG